MPKIRKAIRSFFGDNFREGTSETAESIQPAAPTYNPYDPPAPNSDDNDFFNWGDEDGDTNDEPGITLPEPQPHPTEEPSLDELSALMESPSQKAARETATAEQAPKTPAPEPAASTAEAPEAAPAPEPECKITPDTVPCGDYFLGLRFLAEGLPEDERVADLSTYYRELKNTLTTPQAVKEYINSLVAVDADGNRAAEYVVERYDDGGELSRDIPISDALNTALIADFYYQIDAIIAATPEPEPEPEPEPQPQPGAGNTIAEIAATLKPGDRDIFLKHCAEALAAQKFAAPPAPQPKS